MFRTRRAPHPTYSSSSLVQVTRSNEGRPFRVVVIGNKCDLESERQVQTSEASAWAAQHKISHLEASAKTNHNIANTFETLMRQVLAMAPQDKAEDQNGGDSSGGCCTIS
eukprot:m.194733 g.194733  ORF g.194733 m.194733 type:complete len:110 (-) comp53709_c0_seq4:311-640(-)